MAKKRYSKNKGTQGAANPNSQTPANLPRTKTSNPQAGMKQLISPLKPTTQVASGIWNPTGKPFPDMPEISETTPPLETIGATGVAIFSGIITSEEYNPDFNWRDATKIYEQMLRNDSQIAAIREMVELPIRRTKWSIVPASDSAKDQEIASFVETCLFHDNCYITTEGRKLTQKWDDLLRHMLMHIWYGYMPFEMNFRIEDGWTKWAHWTPLLPRTVWRWWVGEDNELTGIQQWTFKDYNYQFVNIPADKLLLFSHRQEGNNYEGVAALRQIYKNWFYKVQYEKIDAIGIERNAIVPPVITLPENFTPNDAAMALQIVQNLRANELMGVTLPPGWILEYPKNMQKYAADAMTAIKYHDTLMARRLLCQFLNLGSDETGTYALADTQVQTFLSSLQAEAEYIEDVINSDAIPRLVDYNFDGVGNYPTLKCARIQGDITVMGTFLKDILGQNPLLQPYPELQQWAADLMGLPTPPKDQVIATNPTSPANPQQPDVQQATPNAEPKNVQGIQSKDQSGQAMAEVAEQVMLLNESLRAIDAVGRGKEHIMLSNPYPRQKGGRFGFGNGGYKSGGGAGSHRAEAGHMARRGGGGKSSAEHDKAMAHLKEVTEKANKGIAEAKANLAREEAPGNKSREGVFTRNLLRAEISEHEYNIQRAQRDAGIKPETHYKTKMTDEEFRHAFVATHAKLADGSGFAHIKDMQAAFKQEHHMSAKEFSDRMNAMRDDGVDGVHPYRLHMEENEEGMHQLAPHFYAGQQFHFVAVTDLSHGAPPAYRDDPYAHTGGVRPKGESRSETVHTPHESAPKASRSSGGRSSAKSTSKDEESIHEKSARLQREQGLPKERQPNEALVAHNTSRVRDDMTDPLRSNGDAYNIARLRKTFGDEQMGKLYHQESLASLRKAVKAYNSTHDDQIDAKGIGNNHDALASALTAHATEGRYSADFGKGAGSERSGENNHRGAYARAKAEKSSGKGGTRSRSTDERTRPAKSSSTKERITDQKATTGRHGGHGAEAKFRIPNYKPDPLAPLNIRAMHMTYGTHQLRAAFHENTIAKLKGAANGWMRSHPESGKPRSMTRKADIEDYLYHAAVQHDGEIHSAEDVAKAAAREPVKDWAGGSA